MKRRSTLCLILPRREEKKTTPQKKNLSRTLEKNGASAREKGEPGHLFHGRKRERGKSRGFIGTEGREGV